MMSDPYSFTQIALRRAEAAEAQRLHACINCGEAKDGGYVIGNEHEEFVGPFCSQCWAYIKEYPPVPPSAGWQPIETAPKDGTDIVATWVYEVDGMTHWSGTCHVLSWMNDWYGEGKGAWVLDGDFNVHFEPDGIHETPPLAYAEPTHWMPLPPAPETEGTR